MDRHLRQASSEAKTCRNLPTLMGEYTTREWAAKFGRFIWCVFFHQKMHVPIVMPNGETFTLCAQCDKDLIRAAAVEAYK